MRFFLQQSCPPPNHPPILEQSGEHALNTSTCTVHLGGAGVELRASHLGDGHVELHAFNGGRGVGGCTGAEDQRRQP
eukprot:1144660-Pelagomonas_calceolata.AAC.1